MCAKDDLVRRKSPLLTSTQTWEVLFQTHDRQLAGELATVESVTAKDSNYVDTFSSDFAFSFAAWLQRIKCTLGDVDSLFVDARLHDLHTRLPFQSGHDIWIQEDIAKTSSLSGLKNIQQSLLDGATVVPIIISVDKTQLLLISGDVAAWLVYVTIGNLSREARRRRSTPSTLLAGFIPTTKIRDPLLKSQVYHYCMSKLLSQNAAKSRILLACADGRIRQCYPTICAILADYEEQVLLTGVKKNRYCTRLMKMLDFMQDMLDDIYPGSRKTWDNKQKAIIQQLIAVVSPLFVSKAPFALHFIRAVCDLHALTHIIQDIRMYRALDSICTGANSEAHHITMVKQFYSMTNKKEYILQICLHNSRRTALLAADHATVSILGIQPHSTKLPLSEVAANIAISDFTHAAAVFHRDNRRQSRTVTDGRVVAQLHLILIIIDYTCYDKDGKHMAYIRAFSKVLLFNNNGQINNTTGILSVRRRAWNAASKRQILQAFKFYDLSTIIRLVHLVPRDLPNSTTRTTMSYYVNNYIDWDEYNRLYSLTFDIDLLRTLREYRQKRIRNN
ncbi:hypothetical protein HBH51_258630 [Parastagonospora nodorum]|nr:hypothetical protein HBH51_258630 [Parastagonospora nodorum]